MTGWCRERKLPATCGFCLVYLADRTSQPSNRSQELRYRRDAPQVAFKRGAGNELSLQHLPNVRISRQWKQCCWWMIWMILNVLFLFVPWCHRSWCIVWLAQWRFFPQLGLLRESALVHLNFEVESLLLGISEEGKGNEGRTNGNKRNEQKEFKSIAATQCHTKRTVATAL